MLRKCAVVRASQLFDIRHYAFDSPQTALSNSLPMDAKTVTKTVTESDFAGPLWPPGKPFEKNFARTVDPPQTAVIIHHAEHGTAVRPAASSRGDRVVL